METHSDYLCCSPEHLEETTTNVARFVQYQHELAQPFFCMIFVCHWQKDSTRILAPLCQSKLLIKSGQINTSVTWLMVKDSECPLVYFAVCVCRSVSVIEIFHRRILVYLKIKYLMSVIM